MIRPQARSVSGASQRGRIVRIDPRGFRNSLRQLLGGSPSSKTIAAREDRIEKIRERMLDCLGDAARTSPQLARRIRYAGDIERLWYLRGDLMGALAQAHGEAEANRLLEGISRLFKGLVPRGLTSRASPLGH